MRCLFRSFFGWRAGASSCVSMRLDERCVSRPFRLKGGVSLRLNQLVGVPFGSFFNVAKGELVSAEPDEDLFALFGVELDESARDNRDLAFSGNAQQLDDSEIHKLKQSGVDGREIVSTIVSNSATFSGKTELSQEKYLKRKKAKYVCVRGCVRMSYTSAQVSAISSRAETDGSHRVQRVLLV